MLKFTWCSTGLKFRLSWDKEHEVKGNKGNNLDLMFFLVMHTQDYKKALFQICIQ